jgi:UDP-N-acetylglucosamine--N-acetylmuramyl-(pentapeptide) pyrophosphoryl-undecaprenol N-acetylglucosamine transferase
MRARVRPYFTEMELALGAADLAVTRAGASSLAELAAMRVPAFLIPYPHAADDHQRANAQALAAAGAARVQEEATADPSAFANAIATLLGDDGTRQRMQSALAAWHRPDAAARMVEAMRRSLPKAAAAQLAAPPGDPCTCPIR